MKNIDIRNAIEKRRIKYYEIAVALNINPCTLSRWLQSELTQEKKKIIMDIITNFEF